MYLYILLLYVCIYICIYYVYICLDLYTHTHRDKFALITPIPMHKLHFNLPSVHICNSLPHR